MNIFSDIETIPSDSPSIIEYVTANVSPPGTMGKAETIAKWEAEERPAAVEEALAKCALDGAFGKVIVVCMGYDDGSVDRIFDTDEKAVLGEVANTLADVRSPRFVGHSIHWDLRFLFQRYLCNGMSVPISIRRAVEAKPWESDKVFDTMTQFAGVGNRISLEKLCLALGVPSPKKGMDGSQVWSCYKAGRISEIVDYCAGDVAAARAVFRRMTGNDFSRRVLQEHYGGEA